MAKKKETKSRSIDLAAPQTTLLPQDVVEPEMVFVDLSDLPDDEQLHSDPPDASMVATVGAFGVLQPILLIEHGGVASGRRRIKAARQNNHKRIPARIFPKGWTKEQVLTLIENSQRRPNHAADLRSILTLMQVDLDDLLRLPITQGQNEITARDLVDMPLSSDLETMITAACGMDRQTLRHRMGYLNLIPDMMRKFLSGELRSSTAEALAKLPPRQQAAAKSILEDTGKLTLKDVNGVRCVGSVAAGAGLPDALFATPETAAPDNAAEKATWKPSSASKINEILAIVPSGQREIRRALRELLTLLDK